MAQRASLVQPQGAFPAAAAAGKAPTAAGGLPLSKPTAAAGSGAAVVAAAGKGGAASKGAVAATAAGSGAGAGSAAGVRQGEAAPAKRAGSTGPRKRKAADARLIDKVRPAWERSTSNVDSEALRGRARFALAHRAAQGVGRSINLHHWSSTFTARPPAVSALLAPKNSQLLVPTFQPSPSPDAPSPLQQVSSASHSTRQQHFRPLSLHSVHAPPSGGLVGPWLGASHPTQ